MDSATDVANMHVLLQNLMSSDNNVRIQSELDFRHWLESNPDSFSFLLIQSALNDAFSLPIRQASLLHLKRIVPLYWSPAFDKYIGPNTINQDVKKILRDSLLKLISNPDSKIRSSSAYAIVQIAAVDYPDEWPDLLNYLYNSTVDANSSTFEIIGSLSVLQEIFDDVVTEEQFFEGGIAVQVLKTCESLLLNKKEYSLEVQVETLRLLKILCQYFESVDFDIPNRENFCNVVIPQIYQLISNISIQLSKGQSHVNQLTAWDFKFEVYYILNNLLNSFSHLLEAFLNDSFNNILNDLSLQKQIYSSLIHSNDINLIKATFVDIEQFYSSQRERRDPFPLLVSTLTKELEILQTLIELNPIENNEQIATILNLLVELSILPSSKIDDYNSDFNQFVTDESGLNIEITVRDSIRELLSEMNAENNVIFINLLIEKLNIFQSSSISLIDQLNKEVVVYLLACCFDNDDTIVEDPIFDVKEFWVSCIKFITDNSKLKEEFQFLTSRFILMVPKLLFKYSSVCKELGALSFNQVCSILPNLGDSDDFQIIKSSILISLQYYNYFVRAKELTIENQHQLISLVNQLNDDSEEDTNMMLLEAMTIIISINNQQLSQDSSSIELILSIGFKYDKNFALNNSMFECIEDLLKDIPQQNYTNQVSFVFPFLLNKIAEFDGNYDSHIDLSLQVLTTFLKEKENYLIPQDIFNSTFSIINGFICICDDDGLLQSCSESLIELIKSSKDSLSKFVSTESNESGAQILLKSVSKFLSPSMTDRAIVKLGDLVTLLLQDYNDLIGGYLEDILKALTIRLIKATEVPTIENMILIFNMLTISQPKATIDFLKNFQIENTNALNKILPIWFQAYEVMRGYNSILSNVQAFIKIFEINDENVKQILVDGDALPHQLDDGVIITRSMTKRMPIKYKQIPADAKIISLLIDELKNEITSNDSGNQSYHHHHHHYEETVDNDEEDGWEDMEDIGETTFDQLKSYVDEDGFTKRGIDKSNGDMKQLLIAFFKECTLQNISNFEDIYARYLSDVQRKLLSEYLVFT